MWENICVGTRSDGWKKLNNVVARWALAFSTEAFSFYQETASAKIKGASQRHISQVL